MKKKVSITLYILLTTIILIGYQNCGQVKFANSPSESDMKDSSGNDAPNPINPIVPIAEIDSSPDYNPSCTTSLLQELEIQKNFPAVSGCAWGVDGNLEKPLASSNILRARREQQLALSELPADATICKMEFVFPEQPFLYDDHIFLALNERILTTSNSESLIFLETDELGNHIYDWLKLRGQPQPQVMTTSTYCNGVDSICDLPETSPVEDYLGLITMKIHKSTIQKIMENSAQAVPTIKLITTGDDDTLDCRHFNLDFSVKVSYYIN